MSSAHAGQAVLYMVSIPGCGMFNKVIRLVRKFLNASVSRSTFDIQHLEKYTVAPHKNVMMTVFSDGIYVSVNRCCACSNLYCITQFFLYETKSTLEGTGG
ncbi:hypothetical protein D3C86_1299310 [compost metagenome]